MANNPGYSRSQLLCASGRGGYFYAAALALVAAMAVAGEPATDGAAAQQRVPWIAAPTSPQRGGIVSEMRGGVLVHDSGPWASPTEEGYDVNFEVLFTSPRAFKPAGSPRFHAGASINTAGYTSQLYGGITWTGDIKRRFFIEYSFGGSINNGELAETEDRNGLGCHLLFRQSLSAGFLMLVRHSLSLMYDHISNAGFCDENDGQDTFGLRYGYRF